MPKRSIDKDAILLKLKRLLRTKRGKTKSELLDVLDISDRTLLRYLDEIGEESDLVRDRCVPSRYRIIGA